MNSHTSVGGMHKSFYASRDGDERARGGVAAAVRDAVKSSKPPQQMTLLHVAPTKPLPTLPPDIAIEICEFVPSPRDRFVLASLLRLSAIQAEALLRRQKDGLLDCCRDTAILDRFLRHLPRDLLHTAYTFDAIDYEPSVEVLQWWMDSGLELRYTERAIAQACERGRIYVLQWWKDSGLALKYDEWAVRNASKCGQIDVLQWWKDSGLQMKYGKEAINSASESGHLQMLQWWRDSGLPVLYDARAVDWASEAGLTNVLQWWKDSGLEFMYTQDAMKGASYRGQTETLQWWKESGFELKNMNGSVQSAAWSGSIQSLRWWNESGLPIDWSEVDFRTVTDVSILEWWEALGSTGPSRSGTKS